MSVRGRFGFASAGGIDGGIGRYQGRYQDRHAPIPHLVHLGIPDLLALPRSQTTAGCLSWVESVRRVALITGQVQMAPVMCLIDRCLEWPDATGRPEGETDRGFGAAGHQRQGERVSEAASKRLS